MLDLLAERMPGAGVPLAFAASFAHEVNGPSNSEKILSGSSTGWRDGRGSSAEQGAWLDVDEDGVSQHHYEVGVARCGTACPSAAKKSSGLVGWSRVFPLNEGSAAPKDLGIVVFPHDTLKRPEAFPAAYAEFYLVEHLLAMLAPGEELEVATTETTYGTEYTVLLDRSEPDYALVATYALTFVDDGTQITRASRMERYSSGDGVFAEAYDSSRKLIPYGKRLPKQPSLAGAVASKAYLDAEMRRITREFGSLAAGSLNRKAKASGVRVTKEWLLENIDSAASRAGRAISSETIIFRAGVHPLVAAGETRVLVEFVGTSVDGSPNYAQALSVELAVSKGKVVALAPKKDSTFEEAKEIVDSMSTSKGKK